MAGTDIFNREKRSAVMARIRGRGNKATELRLIALMRAARITGWLAVFVDGCFWHGCPQHATQPKQNAAFWREKIARNQARDRTVNRTLRSLGWRVLRIWEHELKASNRRRVLGRLDRALLQAANTRNT
jgi:DNA mismatch endonuclease, patch repair protein